MFKGSIIKMSDISIKKSPKEKFLQAFEDSEKLIASTFPTAKSLFCALERMRNVFRLNPKEHLQALFHKVEAEAKQGALRAPFDQSIVAAVKR